MLGGITYPNNTAVLIEDIGETDMNSLKCISAYGSISLKRQSGDPLPRGRYHCEIPDGRGVLQNLYITIGEL